MTSMRIPCLRTRPRPVRHSLQKHMEGRRGATARLVSLLLVFAALFAGLFTFATPKAYAAGDDHFSSKDRSFYLLSGSLSAYFSSAVTPKNDDSGARGFQGSGASNGWARVVGSPASAGSILGFADDSQFDLTKWVTSQISGSSVTYSYDMMRGLKVIDKNKKTDGKSTVVNASTDGLLQYSHYGATLMDLGLDSTSTELSQNIGRWFGGTIMLLVYTMSFAINGIFALALSLIKTLNPFQLISGAFERQYVDAMGGPLDRGPLVPLHDMITNIYTLIKSLSWMVMVPLFLVGIAITFALRGNQNGETTGKLKTLAIRAGFLVLGIPILGIMFTSSVNSMYDTVTKGGGGANGGASEVVMSTYVDFGEWMQETRLAVPTDCAVIEWDNQRNQASDSSRANLRRTTLCINQSLSHYSSLTKPSAQALTGEDQSSWDQMSTQSSTNPDATTTNYVMDALKRYIMADRLDSGTMETSVKSDLSSMVAYNPDEGKNIDNWFSQYIKPDPDSLSDANPGKSGNEGGNPLIVVAENTGLTVTSHDGIDTYSTRYNNSNLWCGSGLHSNVKAGMGQYAVADEKGNAIGCNMSALAATNYLNTSFGSSAITVYSGKTSSSGAIRQMHTSVSSVGRGIYGILSWFNSVVLILSFIVIAVGYALPMLWNVLKNAFTTIMATPVAMLGSLAGIAKVISYAIAMIVEIIGTLFCYLMMQHVLMAITSLIEGGMAQLFNGAKQTSNGANQGAADQAATAATGAGVVLVSPEVMALLGIGIATVLVIIFTIVALRVRKTMVKGINEAASNLVKKFVNAPEVPPSGGGMGAALAAGAGAGAGQVMMANSMRGGGKGGHSPVTKGTGATGLPGSKPGQTGTGDTTVGMGVEGDQNMLNANDSSQKSIGGIDAPQLEAGPGPAADAPSDGNAVAALEPGPTTTEDQARSEAEQVLSAGDLGAPVEPVEQQSQPSALDAGLNSVEKDAAAETEAAKSNVKAAGEGVKAVGHTAVAAGAAASGNEKTALDEGGKALQGAQNAKGHQQDAKAIREQADATTGTVDNTKPPAQQKDGPGQGQGQSGQGRAPGGAPQPKPIAAPQGKNAPQPSQQAPQKTSGSRPNLKRDMAMGAAMGLSRGNGLKGMAAGAAGGAVVNHISNRPPKQQAPAPAPQPRQQSAPRPAAQRPAPQQTVQSRQVQQSKGPAGHRPSKGARVSK